MATADDVRRTHATVEVRGKRLGMYLEPNSEDGAFGAVVRRFEPVEGGPGEVEATGLVRPGCFITAVNDVNMSGKQFPAIVEVLVTAPRPVRITFRDPAVLEFRDRYDFLRTKLHVEREAAYFASHTAAQAANDKEWHAFLAGLGGTRGASFGVLRLVRDAVGEVVFPLEPAVRVNAMSPIHGRMTGISATSGDAAAVGREATVTAATATSVPAAPSSPSLPPPPFYPIAIYKRCWNVGGIGVAVPPGLGVTLPGDCPRGKSAEGLRDTLRRLVLRGGVPAAYRGPVWWELSGGHAKQALHPPGYYTSLCAATPAPDAAYAISKDLDRTFPGPWAWMCGGVCARSAGQGERVVALLSCHARRGGAGHTFFDRKPNLASLQRVLSAFAVHNPDIG